MILHVEIPHPVTRKAATRPRVSRAQHGLKTRKHQEAARETLRVAIPTLAVITEITVEVIRVMEEVIQEIRGRMCAIRVMEERCQENQVGETRLAMRRVIRPPEIAERARAMVLVMAHVMAEETVQETETHPDHRTTEPRGATIAIVMAPLIAATPTPLPVLRTILEAYLLDMILAVVVLH